MTNVGVTPRLLKQAISEKYLIFAGRYCLLNSHGRKIIKYKVFFFLLIFVATNSLNATTYQSLLLKAHLYKHITLLHLTNLCHYTNQKLH
jgi:hypothetical protein